MKTKTPVVSDPLEVEKVEKHLAADLANFITAFPAPNYLTDTRALVLAALALHRGANWLEDIHNALAAIANKPSY